MKASESLQNDQSTASEHALRRAVDTTPAFIHTARPDGYLDYFNRGWLDFFGKSLEDVCGWRWTESVHPEDVAGIVQKWHAALASGEPFEAEARVRRADGTYRALLHRKVPLHDEQGNIVKWFGSSIDIEDRKCAEEQLRRNAQELQRNEFYLSEGQRLSHAGSWAFDSAGFDYWSPELFRIYGLEPTSTAPTIQEYLNCIHPEDREFMANLVKRVLVEASGFDTTKRIVRPDGEVRYVRCVGAPVVENQTLKKYIGTAVDVTEQEIATQELRRREAYREQAEALSHTGSFGWNLATGELVWSDETFRILEYDRYVKPTVDLIFKRTHPEDLSSVRRVIENAKEGTSLDFEHRLLMPDGSVKHVAVIARPLTSESNEVEFVGTLMDVTARKKAFEEIKALRDELQRENVVLREELGKTSMFEEVIGTSLALQMVLARAAKVAPTDSTVLIMGETGTGKELIARAIHKRSKRSERPFISVNCAAVPSSLIMSELFGHEKGAFTGAVQRRLGRFELAEGGTIFLDEIGDLSMETQIALLRVLQEREFERVGGTQVLRADVRVISATNRDLQAAIADGGFRSDLYYRLNVFPIKLPPLRERKEDVPLLVNYFVDRYAKRAGKKIKHIQKKALEALREYSWPGNVRELQNVIERSLIIGEANEFSIDKSWVANEPQASGTAPADQKTNERKRIEAALAQSNGKVSGAHGAAAKLGIPASTLESKIRSLRINKFQFKGA
ncbi:MAG TPA: sigma 54-interacting transcriptional regulator [Candidatus Udaeobacter sp.]|nr:sigma 54-interacting transcriptional regulator [Candidatus Udaeobacter sp.]